MKIKQFVRKTRNLLQMTAERFSEEIGCSTRTVYRWESGSAEPSGHAILAMISLCKERGIEVDDLVPFFYCQYCHCTIPYLLLK